MSFMRVDPVTLETKNKLMTDYRNQTAEVLERFHYAPFSDITFRERIQDLKERNFERQALMEILLDCNKRFGADGSTLENIKQITNSDTVVVVGGQQAGVLTGPLYTIHKIISILVLAKEQEEKLGVPVLPLFWMAGEDHDFEEINHIYLPYPPRMKKFKIPQKQVAKQPVSEMKLDKDKVSQWLQRIFQLFSETAYTKDLYQTTKHILDEVDSFTDFFAKLVFQLFPNQGLILLDSNNPSLRKLETDYFKEIIKAQPTISHGVAKSLNDATLQGYSIQLDADLEDGHLFYHLNGERILLNRTKDGIWVGKQEECSFTTEQLLEIAEQSPELLSNNVVTRPIMQEFVLPTLAFIAGPGEISYWSVLKSGFESVNLKMPPVVPRLSITLVNRKVEKWMEQHQIDVGYAIKTGVSKGKMEWLSKQSYPPLEELGDELKKTIEEAHRPLREKAKEIRADLGAIAEKNLFQLFENIDFLEQRMEIAIREKHKHSLNKFDQIDCSLRPEGGLQERIWNVYFWLNQFGVEVIEELLNQTYDWNKDHHVAYL